MDNVKEILKRRENLDTIFSVFSEGNTVSKEGVFGSFKTQTDIDDTKKRLSEWLRKTGRFFLLVSLGCDEEDDFMSWGVVKRDFFNISKKRLNDCKKVFCQFRAERSLISSYSIQGTTLNVVVDIRVLIDELSEVKTDDDLQELIFKMNSDIDLLNDSLGFEIKA